MNLKVQAVHHLIEIRIFELNYNFIFINMNLWFRFRCIFIGSNSDLDFKNVSSLFLLKLRSKIGKIQTTLLYYYSKTLADLWFSTFFYRGLYTYVIFICTLIFELLETKVLMFYTDFAGDYYYFRTPNFTPATDFWFFKFWFDVLLPCLQRRCDCGWWNNPNIW